MQQSKDEVDFSDFNRAIAQLQERIRRQKHRNPEVLALLELYRHIASKHKMAHVVISLVNYPPKDPTQIGAPPGVRKDFGCVDYAGDMVLQITQVEQLEKIVEKLRKSISMWSLPERDESLDHSHAVYNTIAGSIGFDFITWLIDMEMARVRHGAPKPLKVAFWLGKDDYKLTPDRAHWIEHVYRPALALIGAVEDGRAMRGHSKDFVCTRDIVLACRAGEKVPRLRELHTVKPRKAPITITLRESEHWPERNSNLDAWKRFARWLMSQGEKVVFVRDTNKIGEPLDDDLFVFQAASINLTDRMALYECAKVNMFVSNGPGWLGLFGSRPWLNFIRPLADDAEFAANTPTFWREMNGIEIGEQYPWSTDHQRIVWAEDSYENIMSAWRTYVVPAKIGHLPLAIAK